MFPSLAKVDVERRNTRIAATGRILPRSKSFYAITPKANGSVHQEELAALAAVSLQTSEDFGGVAFGFDEGPDVFDLAGFADEEGAADDAHELAAHELFFLPGAEFLDGFMGGVAEQGKIEILLGLEGGLGFDGVGAEAENGDTQFVEVFFCVAKLGRFDGSTGSVGFGIEKEEDALAGEVFESEFAAVVGFQAEGGGFGAGFEHGKVLAIGFGSLAGIGSRRTKKGTMFRLLPGICDIVPLQSRSQRPQDEQTRVWR
jgi:hypothetical protein